MNTKITSYGVLASAILANLCLLTPAITQSHRVKKWTPSITTSTAHDSSANQVAYGTDPSGPWSNDSFSKFNTGSNGHAYCGTLTPANGGVLYHINGSQYPAGYNKKVEVSAVVNKGVKYSDSFAWYQSKNGIVSEDGTVFIDTSTLSTTHDGWIGDSNRDGNAPSNSTSQYPVATSQVHSDRTLYLYDIPGVSAQNGTKATQSDSYSYHFRFRDRIYWKTTDASGATIMKDVDRVTSNSPWLPPTTWARNIECQIAKGSTTWTASQNN